MIEEYNQDNGSASTSLQHKHEERWEIREKKIERVLELINLIKSKDKNENEYKKELIKLIEEI
ncbi:MAG: hypothetical protein NT161_02860 [Candidatus Nomurabacteria bacterium]|nr:hypothetical protein [Candidatus Nomurabacteria bacterium]